MFVNAIRSIKAATHLTLAMVGTICLTDVAHANDDAIRVIFETSNIDNTGAQQAEQVLPTGLKLSLSGSDTGDIAGIDKLMAVYPDQQGAYLDSVNAFRDLFGEPVTGRGDLLVWTVKNSNTSNSQSPDTTIIAGTHGQDRHVISLNRQGQARGNNTNSKRPAKTPKPVKVKRPKQSRSPQSGPNRF